jgi:hypothetical protein
MNKSRDGVRPPRRRAADPGSRTDYRRAIARDDLTGFFLMVFTASGGVVAPAPLNGMNCALSVESYHPVGATFVWLMSNHDPIS